MTVTSEDILRGLRDLLNDRYRMNDNEANLRGAVERLKAENERLVKRNGELELANLHADEEVRRHRELTAECDKRIQSAEQRRAQALEEAARYLRERDAARIEIGRLHEVAKVAADDFAKEVGRVVREHAETLEKHRAEAAKLRADLTVAQTGKPVWQWQPAPTSTFWWRGFSTSP